MTVLVLLSGAAMWRAQDAVKEAGEDDPNKPALTERSRRAERVFGVVVWLLIIEAVAVFVIVFLNLLGITRINL